jgi:hypothetical protein
MRNETSFPLNFTFWNQRLHFDVKKFTQRKNLTRYDVNFHRAKCSFVDRAGSWEVSSNFNLSDQLKSVIIQMLQQSQALN